MAEENRSKKSLIIIIIIIIVVIGGGIGIYFAFKGGETSNTNSVSNTNTATNVNQINANTAEDSLSVLMEYNNKTFKVSSDDGNVEGLVGIKVSKDYGATPVKVGYFLKIHSGDFTQEKPNFDAGASYTLVGSHMNANQTRATDNVSTVSPVRCEKEVMPDILAITAGEVTLQEETKRYYECTLDDIESMWVDTEVFYLVYTHYYEDDFTLDTIYKKERLEVYEASQFYVREDYQGTEAWVVDQKSAVANGPILATYNLKYE